MTSFAALMDQYQITRKDLETRLGVSPKAVRNWRNGFCGPSPATARRIEEEFHIPKHLLRPDIWEPPPPTKKIRRPVTAS